MVPGDPDTPRVAVSPARPKAGDPITLRGARWPACPVDLELDGKPIIPARVGVGVQAGDRLVPSPEGVFECSLVTLGLRPRRHAVTATSAHASRPSASARFTV